MHGDVFRALRQLDDFREEEVLAEVRVAIADVGVRGAAADSQANETKKLETHTLAPATQLRR